MNKKVFYIGILFLLMIQPVFALADISEKTEVSMVTIFPGEAVYSHFGHNAFRIRDPETGLDKVYNYGGYNFTEDGFIFKFIMGRLNYLLFTSRFQRDLLTYRTRENRKMIEQKLDLSPGEVRAVYEFLENNALPENRVYLYDFLKDNCATRTWDALDGVLGDQLLTKSCTPSKSYREYLMPYFEKTPWFSFGCNMLMGLPADEMPSFEELMFLPLELMDTYGETAIMQDGMETPLVTDTRLIHDAPFDFKPETAGFTPNSLFVTLFIVTVALMLLLAKTDIRMRWFDVVFFMIMGLLGILLAFMWFVSEHTVTKWNLNILWAFPPHAVFAIVLAVNPKSRLLKPYYVFTAVLCAVMIAGWPIWPQQYHFAVFFIILTTLVRSLSGSGLFKRLLEKTDLLIKHRG